MTSAQLERRLLALERAVKKLKEQQQRFAKQRQNWWLENAGRFANDPIFDEIVRLGKEYRQSLRPPRKNAKHDRP